jgi:DHA1 family bicyclomycin/chloramphenicol resistance-like MFS transporter
VFAGLVALCFFFFGLIAPNFNALAMEPQGHNAGMASSVIGFYSTGAGALFGGLVGHYFDGTVMPLVAGFLIASLLSAAVVVIVEGRAGLWGRNRPDI